MFASFRFHSRCRAARLAALAAILALSLQPERALAAETNPQELVEEARFTIERLLKDSSLPELKPIVEKARGVLIIPELVKGGFIVGAEGGSGVLLIRGSDGSWSPPAFYTLVSGSIGLQLGGQVSEVVFTLMNNGAVEAFLKNEFKLGADASVAVGPLGAGVEASTTTHLSKDIYAFSRSVGLFGGGSLEGAKMVSRKELNQAYYNAPATPREILIERKFFNPGADTLRQTVP